MSAIDAERIDVNIQLDDYIRTYARIEGVDKFVDIDPDLWQNRLDELDPLIAPGWEKTRTVTLPKSAAVESDATQARASDCRVLRAASTCC